MRREIDNLARGFKYQAALKGPMFLKKGLVEGSTAITAVGIALSYSFSPAKKENAHG